LLVRAVLGRMQRVHAEQALERATGCPVAFTELRYPDAAHDVDTPEDLDFVTRRLRERQEQGTLSAGAENA